MNKGVSFDGVPEFLALAERLSVRQAAKDLGKTPGAISQALQRLEQRLGVSLFLRTTRKMALTEAGNDLLNKIQSAARVIESGLEDIAQSGTTPSGTLRLIVERLALPHVIEPVMPVFRQMWPNLKLEITVSNRHENFVAGCYDAGILIGSYIALDMIAVRLSKPFKWAVFGSPDYLEKYGTPQSIGDLMQHECIGFRRPEKGDVYRWEFVDNGAVIKVDPEGSLVVNDGELMRSLAVRGVGLIYSSTFHSSREIKAGTLQPVLLDFSPGQDGLFLYFPKSSQNQPKLRAFIDTCSRVLDLAHG